MSKWALTLGSALALTVALAGAARAGAPAAEAQWIAAARSAVDYGLAQGLPVALQVDSGDALPGHTPLGLMGGAGGCVLVVAARANPTADKLSGMIAPELLELFLEGAAIHELGHCHRRLLGYPHNEKLLPIVAWMAPVRDWFNRRLLTEEAYADMTEVAWLAQRHPERFQALMAQIVDVRTRFREPKHDTLPWLSIAMADGPAPDPMAASGDVFEQAQRRLSRYR